MSRQPWVVLAGIPEKLGTEVVQRLQPNMRGVSWLPLGAGVNYTEYYARGLYDRMCAGFRSKEGNDREKLLSGVRLVVVYLTRANGSEETLFKRFCVEALVLALREDAVGDLSWSRASERREVVNRVVHEINQTVRDAGGLLDAVVEEIGARSARTCLLLPPKNFGRDVTKVFDFMKRAGMQRMTPQQFMSRLKHIAESVTSTRESGRRYFVGRGGLVFRTGPKHGLPPVWSDEEHLSSCVVRGRLRCGASFDPKFHYDCSNATVRVMLKNCHDSPDELSVSGTDYVNIAPNDNVRG